MNPRQLRKLRLRNLQRLPLGDYRIGKQLHG